MALSIFSAFVSLVFLFRDMYYGTEYPLGFTRVLDGPA